MEIGAVVLEKPKGLLGCRGPWAILPLETGSLMCASDIWQRGLGTLPNTQDAQTVPLKCAQAEKAGEREASVRRGIAKRWS